ncbi:MAG TPA: PEP/pyruvate-binding domain-containing protein [Vicinamibacteria bacterium]|nr:PEP/pyruvate-binding domain-containing protein [Vicinamibacteria bacterium]
MTSAGARGRFRPGRVHDFHDLMQHRVMDVLLVASPYDSFLLEEAGELSERMLGEFRNLDLHYGPGLTRVSTGAEALAVVKQQRRFNLILTTVHVGDMNAAELARRVRQEGLDTPVVLLAYDNRELKDFVARRDVSALDRSFLWQGDARILLAIVKYVEDKLNAAHDTATGGVQVILLVEDNVRFYSSFLPTIYAELLTQSQRLISEGMNLADKILRMRARPKILLCGTFEEAWAAFEAYREVLLGVISDIEFPRDGRNCRDAGIELARSIRGPWPDVPVLLQSSRPQNEALAREAGADFLLKGSPLLLHDLRRFMTTNFGFGDFVFRLPDRTEVGRASDLRGLEEALRAVPAASVAYHAQRNHFSKWLKARTEFALAHDLRPRKVSDFKTVEDLRQNLIGSIADYRRERGHVVVADFDRHTFDASGDFYRIGGGSLGGKARGLTFARRLLAEWRINQGRDKVQVAVPPSAVVGTDVFDRFLDDNDLRDFAIAEEDDAVILRRFAEAPFPGETRRDLAAYLERVRYPLAVRSSSILEDSQYQPFTGVYETYMLANNHPFLDVRLDQLVLAVKRVYASTFSRHAKAYLRATPYRLEEEKMAVLLQKIVGAAHGSRFYPDFAGVVRSHNFYPAAPLKADDGIAAVSLGLGRTVVEGGNCLRFSPRYPRHLIQFSSVADILRNTQRDFWALDLGGDGPDGVLMSETRYSLEDAEADGTLAALGSTYSAENDAIYDGISRAGLRVVSFASVLKHGAFPLAEILEHLMEMGRWGVNAPVELEFAVNLSVPPGAPKEFGFLQMRPLALSRETEELELGEVAPENLICRSAHVLGNGKTEVHDLVVVDFHRFDRAQSPETAQAVARFNAELLASGTPYVLVGVGRWGSRDPWLGIPVAWDQISGARVIVEAGFKDFKVTPSQGSHFFQNLTSFNVGYFTVNPDAGDGFVDWDFLAGQPAAGESACVRHLRFPRPVMIKMNGKANQGVIVKPDLG